VEIAAKKRDRLGGKGGGQAQTGGDRLEEDGGGVLNLSLFFLVPVFSEPVPVFSSY
jgi:hypothetical protein